MSPDFKPLPPPMTTLELPNSGRSLLLNSSLNHEVEPDGREIDSKVRIELNRW